mgnify:CR=1 FL=1
MGNIRIKEGSAPATPASGYLEVYVDSADGHLKQKDDAGTVIDLTSSSGEVNTASNVGTAGVGVFKQKTGVDLEFKKINAGSNKVTITDDTGNNELDINVDETNIVHDNLSGFVANEHIDHSSITIAGTGALTGSGTIDSNVNIDLDITAKTALASADPAADYLLIYDTSASTYKKVLPEDLGVTGTGEANTASNIGTGGVGVFKQKTGVDLEFKKINAGSNKITITDDTTNNEIDIDVDPANIDITTLTNFVSNRYIDHTSISITGSGALTGGGTINSNQQIALDISTMTNLGAGDPANDKLLIYDASAGDYKKISPNDLGIATGSGEANTASNVGTAGVGVFKTKTGVDLEFKKINAGSSKVSITDDTGNNEIDIDVVPANISITGLSGYSSSSYVDHTTVSVNGTGALTGGGSIDTSRNITLDYTTKTLLSPADPASDLLLIYDTSASDYKKVTPSDLGITVGETNTVSNIGSSGVGVFKQKSGVNFELKKINSGSSKVTITDDTTNNEIDIDIDPANIPITGLSGYSSNKYLDHTSISITATGALVGGGAIDGNRTIALDIPSMTSLAPADPANDVLLIYDTSASAYKKVIPNQLGIATGEANTASNIGISGVGVFKQKTGVDLEFKKINAGSTKISITDDTGNDEVDIDVVPANIAITGLSGYDANKYIDHTTVSMATAANSGLAGGGTIASTRTLSIDANNLTTDASPVASDYVITYDVSTSTTKKALISTVPGTMDINGLSTATPVSDDAIGFYDASAGANRKAFLYDFIGAREPYGTTNAAISASVAANALTIALISNVGTTPTSTDSVKVVFRNRTLTTGTSSQQTLTSATTLVVPSGATLGCDAINSETDELFVYACWNGSSVQVGVSKTFFDNTDNVVSTTAISASADLASELYVTSGGVTTAIRCMGSIRIFYTAGTGWATSPTRISNNNLNMFGFKRCYSKVVGSGSTVSIPSASATAWTFGTVETQNNITADTTNNRFQITEAGLYKIFARYLMSSVAWTNGTRCSSHIYLNGGVHDTLAYHIARTATYSIDLVGSTSILLKAGDRIEIAFFQNSGSTKTVSGAAADNYVTIERVTPTAAY